MDEGFDVWLSNRRGSLNGKVHRDYEKTDEQFWNFTFHECGFYDIKAEINLIADENTSHKKIILLGFSMGSTETYIYAMLRKKHANNHLAGIISISPIAFMTRSGGVIAKLAPFATLIEVCLVYMVFWSDRTYRSYQNTDSKPSTIRLLSPVIHGQFFSNRSICRAS